MEVSDGFMGMMITLKKRMMCIDEDDTNEYQYLMFGHYDGMDISCTDQWYRLRPKGVEDNRGNVDIKDCFWDKYTLKLYFPEETVCNELEKEGFSYELWKKIGQDRDKNSECKEILEQYPFISVVMVNLSEECVGTETDLMGKMKGVIQEAVSEAGNKLEDIHCVIMPSIGYADFVLLFLSNQLKNVIHVLDSLRKERVWQKERPYAMLSNSYAISGFARAGVDRLGQKNCLDDAKLSIRVNLRDGVSASQFRKFFDAEIGKIMSEKDSKDVNGHRELYQVFGNSDCLVLSDMPFDFFIPLYYDNKLLNPGHELFRRYIQHMRSSIRVGINSEEDAQTIENDGKEKYKQYQEKFKELIEELKKFVKQYKMPVRTVNGLQVVMKIFLNLVQFSHCFDIEKVIGDAFEAMKDNVDKTIELIKAEEETVFQYMYAEQLFEALGIFREKIEDYLADMQRSDRFFIEGQSLSHPSIGSATKLLFFYNKYISDMAEKLVATEEAGGNNQYTFVVTSGGCDVTTAYDLFSYMNPAENNRHSLIIISIPEMSLYDIRGTMFRLLHECLHFCGERKRKERVKALTESFAAGSMSIICHGLEKSIDSYFGEKIGESLHGRVAEGVENDIKSQGKRIIEEEMLHLGKKIEKEIKRRLTDKNEGMEGILYYGRALYPDMLSILKQDVLSEKDFCKFVYQEYMECQMTIANRMMEYLTGQNILFSGANIWKETSKHKLENAVYDENDKEEMILIESIFRNFAEGTAFEKNITKIDEDEQVTADDIIFNLSHVFKECFADCIAAKILKLPMEDFVLCFIYETWNYENAFPENNMETLRIVLELKVLYGISGKLSEDGRKKIKGKVAYWEERGFSYQKHTGYVEELCDRIDMFLAKHDKSNHYIGMDSVEEYLKECVNYYAEKSFGDVETISCQSNMESSDEIYLLLRQIRLSWKNLTKEGEDNVSNEVGAVS